MHHLVKGLLKQTGNIVLGSAGLPPIFDNWPVFLHGVDKFLLYFGNVFPMLCITYFFLIPVIKKIDQKIMSWKPEEEIIFDKKLIQDVYLNKDTLAFEKPLDVVNVEDKLVRYLEVHNKIMSASTETLNFDKPNFFRKNLVTRKEPMFSSTDSFDLKNVKETSWPEFYSEYGEKFQECVKRSRGNFDLCERLNLNYEGVIPTYEEFELIKNAHVHKGLFPFDQPLGGETQEHIANLSFYKNTSLDLSFYCVDQLEKARIGFGTKLVYHNPYTKVAIDYPFVLEVKGHLTTYL